MDPIRGIRFSLKQKNRLLFSTDKDLYYPKNRDSGNALTHKGKRPVSQWEIPDLKRGYTLNSFILYYIHQNSSITKPTFLNLSKNDHSNTNKSLVRKELTAFSFKK